MRIIAEIPDMNNPDKEQRNEALSELASALAQYTSLGRAIDYLEDANQPEHACTVRCAASRLSLKYFEEIN